MADVLALRDAIADACTLQSGLMSGEIVFTYKGMRDQVDTPCAVVGLPRSVTYDNTFQGGGGEDEFEFVVRLLVGRADEVVSEERMARWITRDNVKAWIESDDALAALVQTVHVQQAQGLGIYKYGEIEYLGVEVVVIVTA